MPSESTEQNSPDTNSIYCRIRDIWIEALEKPLADEHVSFFENDGDSLGVTLVLIRIKEDFKVEISLENFFGDPTISGLERAVAERSAPATS